MYKILSDYQEIYNRYPADAFLNKARRKARHSEIMKWTKQEYPTMPTITEIAKFMRSNDTLKYEQPFFLKVVTPCVIKDLGEGRIESLRFLFECNGMDSHRIGTSTDYVHMFNMGVAYQYETWDLADMVLSHEPDNQVVMYYKYISLRRFLDYSTHEAPSFILSGNNGAEKEDMPYLNKNLRDFTTLSKKLGKNDEHFVKECYELYNAWEHSLGLRS
ncbi:MAG: hypothetical protein FWC92_08305 [Defluviitaleaceae bacterium]|nr:hypothetical protein [Defluviitaleaceae bacterium]